MTDRPFDPARRRVLGYGLAGLGMIACGKLLSGCRVKSTFGDRKVISSDLVESGVAGLLVPRGFSARVLATSGAPVPCAEGYTWHAAPDGGATFATEDGGWIYVSNSEINNGGGGVGALRFDAGGNVIAAYPILSNTSRNCAGGPTPWGTWLSCEEIDSGQVWECDPYGEQAARALPALGQFMHEAAAVDPRTLQIYMTEDRRDGRFYRFTPAAVNDGIPDLTEGVLEVAKVHGALEGDVTWHRIEDATGGSRPTRHQVEDSTAFSGGEGAWHADGMVYFTTKGNNRIWAYDIDNARMLLVYDDDMLSPAILTGVDNVTVSQQGTIYVAEDGGNMEIVAIDPEQRIFPVVRLMGQQESEITGPAFDPSGTRLYFSSQRGFSGESSGGITYEVSGPFV